MPGNARSTAGPVEDGKLAGLIEPVVAAAGFDLESVRVTVAGRRRVLRVVVDGDHGVSLDDVADISRDVSAALDAADALGDAPYTLEVWSAGVDRPLTEPRHWRRARGRLVQVKVAGEDTVTGRVLAADADGVTLALAETKAGSKAGGKAKGQARTKAAADERRFSYADLGAGSVQVEFGRIPDAELDEFTDPEPDEAVFAEDTEDLGAGSDGH